MAIDPLSELKRLCDALDARQAELSGLDDWYEGRHPVPPPPPGTAAATDAEARVAFNAMSRLSVTNLLPPIADAPARKLHVEGFRFSESPNSHDADAYRIVMRNELDAEFADSFPTITRRGVGMLLVWPGADGLAEITVEDPMQCIVSYVAGSRRKRRSGLKRWEDDEGYLRANVYLPGSIEKFRSAGPVRSGSGLVLPSSSSDWQHIGTVPNPFGVVPLIELAVNRGIAPRLFGGGRSVFAGQLNEQRKLNRTVMGALVTAEYQEYRQRWVTGWDYPLLEDGTPDKAAIAKAGASRLMVFTKDSMANPMDGEIKVGEFAQADFRPFVDLMLQWVKFMAATSNTPPYAFLLGDMINVAAESLTRIEGMFIANVRAMSWSLNGGLSEAMRLALTIEGNAKASDPVILPAWAEFEDRSAKEQAEMAKVAFDMGAPLEAVYAMLPGIDAAEASRWARQRRADQMLAAALAPQPAAEPVGETGEP